jgi:hypothetical protein
VCCSRGGTKRTAIVVVVLSSASLDIAALAIIW